MKLTLEQFMNAYRLKNQTMKTSGLKNILAGLNINDVDIYPRDSKITTKGICNFDDGSQGGTHWVAFDGSVYFDSFGGSLPIHG